MGFFINSREKRVTPNARGTPSPLTFAQAESIRLCNSWDRFSSTCDRQRFSPIRLPAEELFLFIWDGSLIGLSERDVRDVVKCTAERGRTDG